MDMQLKRLLPARPWEVAALAQARRNVIAMVERTMLAEEGDELAVRLALPRRMVREAVALAADPNARACMECHGLGCHCDPETGPGTCPHCDGMGLLHPAESGSTDS